jgi:D-aspartate ligase
MTSGLPNGRSVRQQRVRRRAPGRTFAGAAHRGPVAVVLNLFYSGLAIARSLGSRGISVIGLTAQRGVYGNFSRYVSAIRCADSHLEPEALFAQLIELGQSLPERGVLFPTRDHDLVFLERYRSELERHFHLVMPRSEALERTLDKWETYLCARRAGVPTPRSWLIRAAEDLRIPAAEARYPCVLKPVAAHHWREAGNWRTLGGRKAVVVESPTALQAEYSRIAQVESRALLQELVEGADDRLIVVACYIDAQAQFRAGFNIQKLVQTPAGFGTGCIVQSIEKTELFERTILLLKEMEFTGIAEVEYKWDDITRDYELIEVNPRPWDQHALGQACGVDLIHLAYCDLTGLPAADATFKWVPRKWIAEDAFLMAALRLLWHREPGIGALFRQARGKKMYAIWSARDPLPFLVYATTLLPKLARLGLEAMVPLVKTAAKRMFIGASA